MASEALQDHQALAIANYIQKPCAKRAQIALAQFQSAALHNVYDNGIIEVAGYYIVVPLKITPQRETRGREISQNRI